MLRFALLFALLASTIGCASGPKGNTVTLPALQAGKSRIVFYRTSSAIGSLDQPNVMSDGFVIGKSEPGYFSYADVAPGAHVIECKAGDAGGVNRISVQTAAGTTTYIETSVKAAINNFKINVEQKPEPEAKQKIAGLKFRPPTNQPPPAPAAAPTTRP